jgi:glycosyltransferase involved in cell wall biosynthesis
MRHILYISYDDPNDRKNWSGTAFACLQQLKKFYNVEIAIIKNGSIDIFISKILKLIFLFGKKNYLTGFSLIRAWVLSKRALKAIRHGNYEVIFVIGSQYTAFLKTDVPIVYLADATFHQLIDYYNFNLSSYSIFSGNLIQKKSFMANSLNIFASKWTKNDAVSFYGVDEKKCAVIHLGANIDDDFMEIHKERSVLTINVLFVGVDWERKGSQIAIDCITELNIKDAKHRYVLQLVGCLPPYEIHNNNVVLHGFVDRNSSDGRKKMHDIFSSCDVFLLPTKAECAGMVFCEASAYGLPVFTFDTGGVSDYVMHGINGFLFPPNSNGADFADKIIFIVNQPEYFKTIATQCRTLYKNELNWSKFGNSLFSSIEGLLSV